MTEPTSDHGENLEWLLIGEKGPRVPVLFPRLCYAPATEVENLRVTELVSSVRSAWPANFGVDDATFPVASLLVTTEPASRFHRDLSNREPIELQVWPDGSTSLEVEFVGEDVRDLPGDWDLMRDVLSAWGRAWGVPLLRLFNDRGRSLPEVWNARFDLGDQDTTIGSALELAQRAITVAEYGRVGTQDVYALRRLVAAGDAHALLAVADRRLLDFHADAPTASHEAELAIAVCAFANTTHGGLVVVGIEAFRAGKRLAADDALGGVPPGREGQVREVVDRMLYPRPEGLRVEAFPLPDERADRVFVVVSIPPQQADLKPFMLHRVDVGAHHRVQFVAIAERVGGEAMTRGVEAIHSRLVAGDALLRRKNG